MTAPPGSCVRSAWLTLGTLSVPLDNPAGGWFCQSLDLGAPVVREVVANHPDRNGVTDRTQYLAGRVITIAVTALAGAGARIDAVASQFAPFMDPSQRPVLHYVLDRPGAAERTMTVRAQAYDWPIVGANERDISLQFLAADPAALDPVVQSQGTWTGSSTVQGRTYPLAFNRIYPPGGGGPTNAVIRSYGDLPIRPKLRIYGPVTQPGVSFTTSPSGTPGGGYIQFLASFTIAAGHFVDVDCATKTAWLDADPTQPVVASIDWQNTIWPYLPVNPAWTLASMHGSTTSGVTQTTISWQDRYLT